MPFLLKINKNFKNMDVLEFIDFVAVNIIKKLLLRFFVNVLYIYSWNGLR